MLKENFELLAPAGSFEILKAVIEAGADAVYVGGSKYGARAYANNFSEEELLEAIDYVHIRGKKLFLTVNTLFKNEELNGLYEYLLPYYERGLDAVIVQDFGVIAYLKEYFPNLPIHTSTQMTITGSEGALLLKQLGAERVVLARELSIEEMKEISQKTGVELEAFVHGALCYSYSGQCLFSSVLGQRSGNRGRCAQPCRLPYTVLDAKGKVQKSESYILSLKDLCGIGYLKQLREAGVYSLKIEGRMKQASYAAGVVSYYRKYIDLEKSVSKEDWKRISELGNRCGFTQEYFLRQNDPSMVTYEKPSYEKSNEALHSAVEANYVGVKSQLPIGGKITMKKGQPLRLAVTLKNGEETITAVSEGAVVAEAFNKPLSYGDVDSRMRKTGESSFCFAELEIEMDEDVFVPNGMLNQLRREALNALEQQILQKYFRSTTEYPKESSKRSVVVPEQTVQYIASCESLKQVQVCLKSETLSAIYLDSQMFGASHFSEELEVWIEKIHHAGKQVFLRLPMIFRKRTADFFATVVLKLQELPLDGIVVRNYEEAAFASSYFADKVLVSDYSLYTYNDLAHRSFRQLGMTYTTIPLELNRKEIKGRDNANSEMVIYGHYPLMVTANCIHKNTSNCDGKAELLYLKDRYQVLFPVKNFCASCYNVIYNSLPTCLLEETDAIQNMNIRRMRLEFTVEDEKETEEVLAYLEQKCPSDCGRQKAYTKGHYKRGVE